MIILIYVVVGFLTFGWRWNRTPDDLFGGREIGCLFAGVFFWIYWPALGAIAITKPKAA